MTGLKTNTVLLLPHDNEWDKIAAQTITLIKQILGETCTDAQHIGSTSIKTISAKPIIDIAVAVKELSHITPYIDALKENGIFYRKEEYDRQILFLMGDLENDVKTHHIHIVESDSSNWHNYINFRDYLNTFPDKAKEYDELKQRLANQFPTDRKSYTSGKEELISELLREAKQWRDSQK